MGSANNPVELDDVRLVAPMSQVVYSRLTTSYERDDITLHDRAAIRGIADMLTPLKRLIAIGSCAGARGSNPAPKGIVRPASIPTDTTNAMRPLG
jgi:hypothetical protein